MFRSLSLTTSALWLSNDFSESPTSSPGQCHIKPTLLSASAASNSKNHFCIKCVDGTRVVPYNVPCRKDQLLRLKKEKFDVLVIGGGASGSGIALDASMRGLSVAMVEREDFCSGTSSRSTKLIHGGIRYLENAFKNLDPKEYDLVKEALRERKHMLEAAPYMNKPFPIMIPMFWKNWYDIFLLPYYYVGAKCYDFVAGSGKAVPGSSFMSADEAKFQFPMLDDNNLLGAIIYYDGQMNDSRMGLHLALTATQAGAAICSCVKVQSLIHDKKTKKIVGAKVKDTEESKTFQIDARVVINATGPFSDAIRKMDDPSVKNIIKGAAGVHIVLPDHYSPSKMGLIIPSTSDGRVLFFLPWENGTIAGTTDSSPELTMQPRATSEDIGFILEEGESHSVFACLDEYENTRAGSREMVADIMATFTSSTKPNIIPHT